MAISLSNDGAVIVTDSKGREWRFPSIGEALAFVRGQHHDRLSRECKADLQRLTPTARSYWRGRA